ncbi:MAG: trehalose-phosphatase [Actinomycetota bacterium]|nr:trehalose-phosphatase [Actinomycetota bacterium]
MSSYVVSSLLESPEQTGVFLDFDGTLSEIVDDPAAARPVEGADEVLSDLGSRLKLVAVVSGRSAHQLVDWLGPDAEIWGLHGAERSIDGRVEVAEQAQPFVARMAVVAEQARAQLAHLGVEVENKGAMLGLHYRRASDPGTAGSRVSEAATALARDHDLAVGHGRMVVELRPPIAFSKADVVLRRSRESDLKAAAFVGDDVVDLPAFDALEELAREGVAIARVAVDSPEAPPELLERADVVVTGPRGVVEWLSLLRG